MFKVKTPDQKGVAPFSGISHGLNFDKGLSEEFDNSELKDRLVMKGYVLVEEEKQKAPSIEELRLIATELGIDTKDMKKSDIDKAIKELQSNQ